MFDNDELLTYDIADLNGPAIYSNGMVVAYVDRMSNLVGLWHTGDTRWYCASLRFDFRYRDESLMPLVTRFHPAYQETIYGTEGIVVAQRAFVPYQAGYPQAMLWQMNLQAEGHRLLQIEVDIRWSAGDQAAEAMEQHMESGLLVCQTEPEAQSSLLGQRRALQTRVFGSSGPPVKTDLDLPGAARLTYYVLIEGYVDVPFTLTISAAGEQMAWNGFLANQEIGNVFTDTRHTLGSRLRTSKVVTPLPTINRALNWAGVNALRGARHYAQTSGIGCELTSELVDVSRSARYVLGADYLLPTFTDAVMDTLTQRAVTSTGRVADSLHGRSGTVQATGRGVNAATPLLIIALSHHYAVTGDPDSLAHGYPAVRSAAHYLVRQKDDRATPELHALTCWALQAATELATEIGDETNAALFQSEAAARAHVFGKSLVAAMKTDPQTVSTSTLALALLADLPGGANALPLLIARWQDGQWMSGQWCQVQHSAGSLELTAWVGLALAPHAPDLLAQLLHMLAELLTPEKPRAVGLVPGQIPTEVDLDFVQVRGATLEPVAGAAYVQLALEGLMGLKPAGRLPLVRPALPSGWDWLIAADIPYAGNRLTLIWHEGVLHASQPVHSDHPIELYETIRPQQAAGPTFLLERNGRGWLFAAAPETRQETVYVNGQPVDIQLDAGQAQLLSLS
ncbi:MAG TPA: hypothetical protein EYP04_07255 [Anaerolineae bacterium]|nr:hypothetical protein [Anaerolineae bacterium]HIQ04919.1 hypothetical protein [Anaerolineae bacterium]